MVHENIGTFFSSLERFAGSNETDKDVDVHVKIERANTSDTLRTILTQSSNMSDNARLVYDVLNTMRLCCNKHLQRYCNDNSIVNVYVGIDDGIRNRTSELRQVDIESLALDLKRLSYEVNYSESQNIATVASH